MDQRYNFLLQGLVHEYIRTARPVGSTALGHSLNLDLSPATIRNILHELEAAGFIYQPHTSAGRVPTDKGYRHFVDNASLEPTQAQVRSVVEEYHRMQDEYRHRARAAAKLLSKLSHAIAISGWLESGEVQEAGLSEILAESEGERNDTVQEISRVLQGVDKYLRQLYAEQRLGVQVYIGQENPLYSSQYTSLIVRTVKLADGEKVVLVVVGPKRMEYARNIRTINALADIINNENTSL